MEVRSPGPPGPPPWPPCHLPASTVLCGCGPEENPCGFFSLPFRPPCLLIFCTSSPSRLTHTSREEAQIHFNINYLTITRIWDPVIFFNVSFITDYRSSSNITDAKQIAVYQISECTNSISRRREKVPLPNKEPEPGPPERWGNRQRYANEESQDILYKVCQNPNSVVRCFIFP